MRHHVQLGFGVIIFLMVLATVGVASGGGGVDWIWQAVARINSRIRLSDNCILGMVLSFLYLIRINDLGLSSSNL